MAILLGTTVGGPVVPGDSENDIFPTHYDWLGNGGWRAVATVAKRNSITAERRALGMTVYVIDENKNYKLLDGLTNDDWKVSNEIVSAENSPAPTTEIWKGTQAQFMAIYNAGLNEKVLYHFIKETQVVRAPLQSVSYLLNMWDNNTVQLVLTECNFKLMMIEGLFDCTIAIAENVPVIIYGGAELSRVVNGVKTTGDQLLGPGIHRIIRKGTTSEFKIC